MQFLDTKRDKAGLLILALGVTILIALTPFLSGLLGAGVLYVLCIGPYRRMARVMPDGVASVLTLVGAVVVIALPFAWVVSVIISRAPDTLRSVQDNLVIEQLSQLSIGGFDIGEQIAQASGTLATWLSSQALNFMGGAASASLNLVIAFFGLYYMLHSGATLWDGFRVYVPFSADTADALRLHFHRVTQATLLGTVATAAAQGILIGLAFFLSGLPEPVFWGAMAAFASILPVLGTGLVWLPAVLVLFFQDRLGAMLVMLVVGSLVASNVDNFIRPLVYRRVSNIHPMVTLVGAFAGIKYFGLPGLLLGPLGIAYFFELLRFYKMEYGDGADGADAATA